MSGNEFKWTRRNSRAGIVSLFCLAALGLAISGCKKPAPPAQQAQRYHLVGKIVSIDHDQASIMVDGQEIVGFMSAISSKTVLPSVEKVRLRT